MVVIILENVPTGLRGELTRWMLEPRAGVFVGDVSGAVRDSLWKLVCTKMKSGAGMLFFNAFTEQGFAVRFHGPASRIVEDFDGLFLIRRPEKEDTLATSA
jgi:CRISPR-associated protein Cas2